MSGNRSTPAPKKKATPGSGAAQKSAQKSSQKSGKSGKSSGSRSVGARIRSALKWLLIVGLVSSLIMASIGYFAYRNTEIPDANKAFEAQSTYVYYSGGKARIGRFADQNRESIPLADIPSSMQDAVIAAEDRTFYTNSGIDPKGILRAAFSNAKGNSTQGASTITQQYVKILYLTQERTLSRKVKEAFLSLKVQQEKSKVAILEGYLNTIYFGRGAYGVQAAAKAYFNKPAKKLTVPESAMLSAVINSPNYLSPDRGAEGRAALLERYDYVLDGMVSMGNLEAAEADEFRGELPAVGKARASDMYGGQRGFMLTMVKEELVRLGFEESEIDSGGLRIETTFTKKAMQAAEEGVLEQRPQGLKKLHVATASIDVKTGALVGFYAGQDYLQSQLNWARLGGSPGSSFKPFALAAGLKDGFALKDTFDGNAPFELPDGGGEVGNQGEGQGKSYGSAISLITATENSVNTAYVDLTTAMEDGPQKVIRMANALGVPKNAPGLKPFPAVALGSATVSPIDMANSYATIANGGLHHSWFTVKKVTRASDDAGALQGAPEDQSRPVGRHRLRRELRPPADGAERHGEHRPQPGPSRRSQDRNRDQRRRGRLVVLVRRVHPADRHGGDVRARQGQRGAQRLPPGLLRRGLPRRHLDGGDGTADGRCRGGGLPRARLRRRRGPRRRARAVHATSAEADAQAEAQQAECDSDHACTGVAGTPGSGPAVPGRQPGRQPGWRQPGWRQRAASRQPL